MKRILLSAILIAAITIGCTGCTFVSKKKGVNELALEYLEEKYGEKFEYIQPAGNSMTGTRNFVASCNSHGRVLVQVDDYQDEENRVFRDNHIAVKYVNQTQDFIKEIIDKEFSESKVYYSAAEKALSADLPGNASFEQFLADPESRISAVAVVKSSDYSDNNQLDAVCKEVLTSFAASSLNLKIHIVGDSEFDSFTQGTHDKAFLSGDYDKYAHLYRSSDTSVLEIFSRGGELDDQIEY